MALKTDFTSSPAPKSVSAAYATVHGRMYKSSNGTRVMALKRGDGGDTLFMNLGGGEGGSKYYLPGTLFTSVTFPLSELPNGTTFTAVQD